MGLTFGTDLSGKVAVVTGAGGVLCGMFARTLSEAGAAVALLDINEEAAAKAADEITRLGGRAVAYRADVMDKEELESVHARVLAQMCIRDRRWAVRGGWCAGRNAAAGAGREIGRAHV